MAGAACLALVFSSHLFAQSPAAPPAGPEFFNRYDFHLGANALSVDDAGFSWETHFGGELDVADYVIGRTSVIVDYQAILGDEFRPFDPNQAYYALEVSSSYRAGGTEIAGFFHHVSRHLSDRPKQFPIAWNVAGVRVLRRVDVSGVRVDVRAEAGSVVQHSHVDYSWTAGLDVMMRRAINSRVGVFAHGTGDKVGVDGTQAGRESQTGGRVEAGVRVEGRAGALELFAGYERRIDADPLGLQSRRWGLAGFRLLSK